MPAARQGRTGEDPGVGQVQLFGGGDYAMRIWLDPDKIAARGMTAGDVSRAMREQNVQVSAGQLGAEPMPNGSDFLLSINAKGRLATAEEFGDIVLKSGQPAARSCACATSPASSSAPATTPARAASTARTRRRSASSRRRARTRCRSAMRWSRRWTSCKKTFPPGIDLSARLRHHGVRASSIKAVVQTLLEAILLVVLVVILFLQTWRASIIPLLAVPVSVVGTFAVLYLLGFSINTLTLFGLVLAIGIVVDDAIVVVENVERNIEARPTPLEAAHQAMQEVSGPIIAIALVLCAVFVPMAFMAA
jgi:multidrug efflux pump